MEQELACRDGSDEGVISAPELILLWAVRLASLPFLVLIIVIAALIYGVASLGRLVVVLGRRLLGPGKTWNPRVTTHDA